MFVLSAPGGMGVAMFMNTFFDLCCSFAKLQIAHILTHLFFHTIANYDNFTIDACKLNNAFNAFICILITITGSDNKHMYMKSF